MTAARAPAAIALDTFSEKKRVPREIKAMFPLTCGGKLVGSNFYWLSTKQETLQWEKSTWYTTPTCR